MSVPASVVTVTGLRDTRTATWWNDQKIPAEQRTARSLGNVTRSGTPNHAPWSTSPSHRPTTSTASHAGSDQPSEGAAPGCSTGPAPVAIERA